MFRFPYASRNTVIAVCAALTLVAVLATSSLPVFQGTDRQQEHTVSTPAPRTGQQSPYPSQQGADRLVEQQHIAARQALQQIGKDEYQGEITTRPDFISPIEWQVLQNVAAGHESPIQELTRLTNRLRFAKLREKWDDAVNNDDRRLRDALGNQLLHDLPHRVDNHEIDQQQAQQFQTQILAIIIDDQEERQHRAALEAERIGVQFEIRREG